MITLGAMVLAPPRGFSAARTTPLAIAARVAAAPEARFAPPPTLKQSAAVRTLFGSSGSSTTSPATPISVQAATTNAAPLEPSAAVKTLFGGGGGGDSGASSSSSDASGGDAGASSPAFVPFDRGAPTPALDRSTVGVNVEAPDYVWYAALAVTLAGGAWLLWKRKHAR